VDSPSVANQTPFAASLPPTPTSSPNTTSLPFVTPTEMASQQSLTRPSPMVSEAPKAGGYNFTVIAIVILSVFFLILYVMLYYGKLNMVTDLVGGERVVNHRKIVWWCVILTAIFAIILAVGYKSMK
jgi:hypothetical protein